MRRVRVSRVIFRRLQLIPGFQEIPVLSDVGASDLAENGKRPKLLLFYYYYFFFFKSVRDFFSAHSLFENASMR